MKEYIYQNMFGDEEVHWWYVARRKILLAEIDALLAREKQRGGAKPLRILDYGCGTGRNLVALNERGIACGLDASPEAVAYCHQRGLKDVMLIDPEKLARGENPFGTDFDLIVLTDVLEHFEYDSMLLKQLMALLRPGGMLFLTVPAYEFLWSGEDYVSQHFRRYTGRSLRRVLEGNGFNVERSSYFNTLLFPAQVGVILWNRLFRPHRMYETNVTPTAPWLNTLLEQIFAAELPLLAAARLPFGGSILAHARRK